MSIQINAARRLVLTAGFEEDKQQVVSWLKKVFPKAKATSDGVVFSVPNSGTKKSADVTFKCTNSLSGITLTWKFPHTDDGPTGYVDGKNVKALLKQFSTKVGKAVGTNYYTYVPEFKKLMSNAAEQAKKGV